MMTMEKKFFVVVCLILSLLQSACTFNPFRTRNDITGSREATVIGAAAGAGTVALLGGSKPLILAAGIGGGALGYYLTTLRHDAGGVIEAGGQVYQVGDYVGIDVPSDQLFEVNTAEFLPQANYILDSVLSVLQRFPRNNILISGNTSGFALSRWEKKLSLRRARRVAEYLQNAGINNFKNPGIDTRQLSYVGYGNHFPIASRLTNDGVRQNSRIQITSYPSAGDLQLDKRHLAVHNIGSLDDDVGNGKAVEDCSKNDYKSECHAKKYKM